MDQEHSIVRLTESLLGADNNTDDENYKTVIFPPLPNPSSQLPDQLVGYLDLNIALPTDQEFKKIMAKKNGRSTSVSIERRHVADKTTKDRERMSWLVFGVVLLCLAMWYNWIIGITSSLFLGFVFTVNRIIDQRERATRYPQPQNNSVPI